MRIIDVDAFLENNKEFADWGKNKRMKNLKIKVKKNIH